MTEYPMHKSPRCGAKSKRSGVRCKSPAVNGWAVCRMHGARSGSKAGPLANNYRHGMRTKEAENFRRNVQQLERLLVDLEQTLEPQNKEPV